MATSNEQQQLRQLYERTWAAMVAKDESVLHALHTSDFVLVHMTGVRQGKHDYIAAIMRGTLNYYNAVTESLEINVRGHEATIDGRSRVEAAVYGGARHTWRLRLRFTARMEGGVWRMSRSEASTY